MKILWHLPYKNINNAGRTIYVGYRNAFLDLGHSFETLSAEDRFSELYEKFKPDIFVSSLNKYHFKYLNLDYLKVFRKEGLVVFVNIPSWKDPSRKKRVNETFDIAGNSYLRDLVVKDRVADFYYGAYEEWDPRISDFEKETGQKYVTLPLAADRITLKSVRDKKFESDISFIGTNLPDKRKFFREYVYPLRKEYRVRLYGQGWTFLDRFLDDVGKFGKYFDIKFLGNLNTQKLSLNDEGKIYKSSGISINVHQISQREYGGDSNERTFKIPLCGGFELTDDVECIRKYFIEDKEIVIAKNKRDWFEKISYYLNNPEKRLPIIKAGRERVLKDHTYHNRVKKITELYNMFKD